MFRNFCAPVLVRPLVSNFNICAQLYFFPGIHLHEIVFNFFLSVFYNYRGWGNLAGMPFMDTVSTPLKIPRGILQECISSKLSPRILGTPPKVPLGVLRMAPLGINPEI